MILSIVLTKAKENPLTELLSPKGGLFAPCGLPKPLPLGEVALRSNDGEGKPGRKEPQAQRWAGSLSERYYRSVWDSPSASLPSQSRRKLLAKAGLRLPASASLPLASCWPLPQQLLPVSATGGGRRRCPKGGAIGMSVSFRLDERSTISRKQQCSAVQASDSLTRSVVQKPLSP